MKARYVREIKANFPYPIAAIFKRLFTDDCLDPGPWRLKYIIDTAEAVARFLGVLVLCECREHLEGKDIPVPESLNVDFNIRFKRVSWGNWLHFAREGLKWLQQNQARLIVEELPDFYFKVLPQESDAANALSELLTIRNGLSHGKIQPIHQYEYKKLCDQTYPLLETVLDAMEFLLDYELTYVSRIEVKKRRKREPKFLHRFKKICGDSDCFPGDEEKLALFMDPRNLVFVNLENHRYLNLNPLLLYEEAAGKAPDIFFYNGMDNPGSADYSACRHGGNFNSGKAEREGKIESERAAEIAEELQGFIDLYCPGKLQEAKDG